MKILQYLWSVLVMCLHVLLAKMVRGPPRQPTTLDPFDPDTPLLYLSPVDALVIREAMEGISIMGTTGSGKTSGSGAAIAKAFLRAGFGGLVMCAKPEERRLWEEYAEKTGRSDSLIIVSPDHPHRFNFLGYEMERKGRGGGQTENLVNIFSEVIEQVEGKVEQGGGDAYFPRAMREMLRNAIDILSIAEGRISLDNISKLIASAPQCPEDVEVEEVHNEQIYGEWWEKSFCGQCLTKAKEKEKTARQEHDLGVARSYWTTNFATLSDRTRSSIVSTFTSVADMLMHGIAYELLCTETNIVPELTYRDGAIIILDLPIQEFGQVGRIVQLIFKLMFQRAILRRDAKQHPRPVFLWADEAQNFVSSFDYQVQAVARSALLSTVYLTQSLSNYYATLGGAQGQAEAHALLTNFVTKIFHANSDHATNQYAADLIAQHWTVKAGGGSSGGGPNTSWNEVMAYKVLPAEFTTLRKGGPANHLQVDAIISQGGKIFNATRDTYLKTAFTQEKKQTK